MSGSDHKTRHRWIDFGVPKPRCAPLEYIPFEWPYTAIESLPLPTERLDIGFFHVLEKRRSVRDHGDLSISDLASLLWFTCRIKSWGDNSALGFPCSLRPVPSAGAIHPIHVLISSPTSGGWKRYIPESHSFGTIDANVVSDIPFRETLAEFFPCSHSIIISLVAEPGKTASKYEFPESLVWRDAGVLQGFFAITAAALDINLCPVGVTGAPLAFNLDKEGHLLDVGVLLLGSAP
jgi:SagB-type dehydrogenase family enzyme